MPGAARTEELRGVDTLGITGRELPFGPFGRGGGRSFSYHGGEGGAPHENPGPEQRRPARELAAFGPIESGLPPLWAPSSRHDDHARQGDDKTQQSAENVETVDRGDVWVPRMSSGQCQQDFRRLTPNDEAGPWRCPRFTWPSSEYFNWSGSR